MLNITEFMVYGNKVEKGRNDKIQVKKRAINTLQPF